MPSCDSVKQEVDNLKYSGAQLGATTIILISNYCLADQSKDGNIQSAIGDLSDAIKQYERIEESKPGKTKSEPIFRLLFSRLFCARAKLLLVGQKDEAKAIADWGTCQDLTSP